MFAFKEISLIGHVLDHMIDHILDYLLDHKFDYMIIGFVTIALYITCGLNKVLMKPFISSAMGL